MSISGPSVVVGQAKKMRGGATAMRRCALVSREVGVRGEGDESASVEFSSWEVEIGGR